jgi:hypothetical protein
MTDAYEQQRKAMIRQMVEAADNSPEAKRKRAIEALGTKYLLHPDNAPKRGVYNPMTGARLS